MVRATGRSGRRSARASALLPSEIHIFAPLIVQPSSVFTARVFWLAAPEPVSGSVRPKQPSHSPRAEERQVALLLLLGAPLEDRRADERGLHGDDGAHRRAAAADLLADQRVGRRSRGRRRRTPAGRSRRGSPARRSSRRARGRSGARGCCARRPASTSLSVNSRGRLLDQPLLVGQLEVHADSLRFRAIDGEEQRLADRQQRERRRRRCPRTRRVEQPERVVAREPPRVALEEDAVEGGEGGVEVDEQEERREAEQADRGERAPPQAAVQRGARRRRGPRVAIQATARSTTRDAPRRSAGRS